MSFPGLTQLHDKVHNEINGLDMLIPENKWILKELSKLHEAIHAKEKKIKKLMKEGI
jgi:hypothetical protein